MSERSDLHTSSFELAISALIISMLAGGCLPTDRIRSTAGSSGQVLEDIHFADPLNVQVARLPGVFMSKSGELRIRRALDPPLIVVDGTQMAIRRGDLSFLDPAEVARIEVVKGPETAYYGQLGVNGVIKVTTKHEIAVQNH